MRLLLVPAAVAVLLAYTPTKFVAAQPPADPPAAGPVKDRVKMDDATKRRSPRRSGG